jgi:hypothetical protein
MARDDRQLRLPLGPRLEVLAGGGQRRRESLASRDAVARVLVEAGADLLLRRISVPRAEAIEVEVEAVLALFDRVDGEPRLLPELERRLDELERLVTETRERARTGRAARASRGGV